MIYYDVLFHFSVFFFKIFSNHANKKIEREEELGQMGQDGQAWAGEENFQR